jgi:hypothetical protein
MLICWPPLWSSGSWLQIQRTGFDSQRCLIFWEVVGLEWGPLSLVSTIEELLERKSSGSGLENREYGRRDPSGWPRGTLYPQKLTLSSPTSGGRSVGIVHSWTQAIEFRDLWEVLIGFYCTFSACIRNSLIISSFTMWYRFRVEAVARYYQDGT